MTESEQTLKDILLKLGDIQLTLLEIQEQNSEAAILWDRIESTLSKMHELNLALASAQVSGAL
jgi:hypothetical protein